MILQIYIRQNFNPRSPHGERPLSRLCSNGRMSYFNPRSPHGERPVCAFHVGGNFCISTHAPRTGSDSAIESAIDAAKDFNPRSPHGERRYYAVCCNREQDNFNPRSPHGERRVIRWLRNQPRIFQPTLPARGATWSNASSAFSMVISTHAPRTGSDPHAIHLVDAQILFQPTLPARGATSCIPQLARNLKISTHAPRTGSDPSASHPSAPIRTISTHAPRTGSDGDFSSGNKNLEISTHAPRTGSDVIRR